MVSGEPTSVLLPLPKPEASANSQKDCAGVVEWKPPHIDWNPWTCCSAYQASGPYNTMEPEARATQLSQGLCEEMRQRKLQDHDFCKVSRGVGRRVAAVVLWGHDFKWGCGSVGVAGRNCCTGQKCV